MGTFVADDLALALAVRTDLHLLHLAEDRLPHAGDAAFALTVGAGVHHSVGRTRAVAVRTGDSLADFDFLLNAGCGFLEGHLDFDAEVIAATRHRTAASAAEERREASASAAHAPRLEQVAEVGEDVGHVHVLCRETAHAAHAGKAELVVTLTFLRVTENLVRLRRLFELLLRLLVTGIFVRVILHGKLMVSLLYFSIR